MLQVFEKGTKIPIHGGKLIEEFIGVQRGIDEYSIAHMVMPINWTEPAHGTKFDELIIVIKGTLTIIENDNNYCITRDQVGWLKPSEGVIFCNKKNEICEYWSICIPAYNTSRVYNTDE